MLSVLFYSQIPYAVSDCYGVESSIIPREL